MTAEPWKTIVLPDWLKEVEEAAYKHAIGNLSRSEQANLFAEHAMDMVTKIRQLMYATGSAITRDGVPYGNGSKVYYRDPTGYIQSLDVGLSFRTDSSLPSPVYHPHPVYSTQEAAEEAYRGSSVT